MEESGGNYEPMNIRKELWVQAETCHYFSPASEGLQSRGIDAQTRTSFSLGRSKNKMTERNRRSSVRTRMKTEDVSTWVSSNKRVYAPTPQVAHVHFAPTTTVENVDDDLSDTESSDSTLVEQPRYLDGGYAWFIVCASFVLHVILDGLSFGFGIFFPLIQKHFKSQRTGASFVGALLLSLPLALAPIAGTVTDLFDCRITILIGGFTCFLAVLASLWCDSVGMFAVVFGGGCGLGMSFVFNAAIVMVTYYFQERRGIATAIAVSGTGVGTFLFPSYLGSISELIGNEFYGSLISILIWVSLIVVIGLAVKDVQWVSDTHEYKEKMFLRRMKQMQEDGESLRVNCYTDEAFEQPLRRACSLPNISTSLLTRLRDIGSSVQSVKDAADVLDIPTRSRSVGTFMARRTALQTLPEYTMLTLDENLEHLQHLDLQTSNSPAVTIHSRRKNRRRILSKTSMSMDRIDDIGSQEKLNLSFHCYSSSGEESEDEDLEESSTSDSEMSNDGDSSSSELTDKVIQPKPKELPSTETPREVKSIPPAPAMDLKNFGRFDRASIARGMSAGRVMAGNAVEARNRLSMHTIGLKFRYDSAPALAARQKRKNKFGKFGLGMVRDASSSVTEEVGTYRSLLRDRNFVLYLVHLTLLYAVLDVPYVFLIDHCTESLMIPLSSAKYLTSAIGICNFVSTFCWGLLADIKCCKKYLFLISSFAVFGISGVLFAAIFVTSFYGMIFLSGLYGCLISSNFVFQSILLTTINTDMSVFQSSYSFAGLCEGLATILAPPLFGLLRDGFGSYTLVFFFSSLIFFASGLVLVRIAIRLRNEEEENKSPTNGISTALEVKDPLLPDV
ncbi:unnamed protein product [Caenorhabditis auriculariae]|uniref:Major facilitator superfamily (MFS) profile domain-containing protein n=1 Tax=Caenorhabditis auriculariae TaxID=2777116 RepID=A0A8S1GVV5_9PELO|nr:unnamed protein product [Caenorhabditis auriculariae]